MECRVTRSFKSNCAGLGAADFVVAMGLLGGLMCTLAVNYVYFSRAFARLQNSMYMNDKSRYAMDRINRDIRQASSIVSYSSNQLTLLLKGTNVTYSFDPTNKTLTRLSAGTSQIYLTSCNYLRFDVFQRDTTSNSFGLVLATNLSVAKVVQMDWDCSQALSTVPVSSESIQSGTVTIRQR